MEMSERDTARGMGSSTPTSTSQTPPPRINSNSSLTNASAASSGAATARRRHKQILKCTQCRLDKQRCTPIDRVWPNRCDRCMKYNHSCSPGLNAREERRRQAPSSFPLSFRTPHAQGEGKGQSERISPTPSGAYAPNVRPHMMRVPSPGTASSTGGSDDDHDQGFGEYEGTMHSGDRSRFAGYPGHDASFAGHMGGLPILEGLAQEVGGSSVGVSSFASKYLEALARQTDVSTNLPSPSISNPSTPIYPFQLSSHTPGYAYSYFPHMITHPPPRPRSPISRTLNARYNQFWTQNNPFAFVCTSSPRFSSTLHTIFSRYIPPYAETDDMVNHALMAFSAADAEKECSSGEWHRKLNIAGLRHAGKCQRMLGVRLGKLRLGSSEQREEINPMVTDTEITAVKLSIVLMLCYGLCIADVSLVRLTTQLLALSKTIPAYSPSTSYVATIPIASTFTEYPGGGFRVRLYLDKSHSGNEQEEPGMILGHDIHPFKQLRTEFEKQFRTETYLQLLMEDCEDDGEEEGEDGEGGDDASGSGIVHDAMEPITREVKPRPEMLRLTTTLSGHGMNTRQSIITPTSATTPSLAVSSFSGLGHPSGSNLEYSTSVGTFGIAPHPIAHSHHPPASGINASAPPMGLNGSGYMYMPAGSTGSYQSVSPQLPPQHTLSTSNEDNCRMIHMQLHRNMDI